MKARPKPKPWVTNALTGELVAPDVAWLIDRLAALNPAANDRPDVVDYHVHQIRGHWLTWRWRGDTAAIKIRGTQRPRAQRVNAKGRTERELKRLLRAAQGRSDKRWITAWLGVSSKTHGLIGWRPHGSGGFEISLRGIHAVIPTRADAMPLIEAAIQKLESVPAAKRRKRKRDTLADDFVGAVRLAQRVMVHDSKVHHGNGLARLGRDINERFHCDFIF
jgi:hypothetical protein